MPDLGKFRSAIRRKAQDRPSSPRFAKMPAIWLALEPEALARELRLCRLNATPKIESHIRLLALRARDRQSTRQPALTGIGPTAYHTPLFSPQYARGSPLPRRKRRTGIAV